MARCETTEPAEHPEVVARLSEARARRIDESAAFARESGTPQPLSPEARDALKALGYIQ